MKRLLIALLTFLLGVSSFQFLHWKKSEIPQTELPVQEKIEIIERSEIQTPVTSVQETNNSKPFFNSFNDDEDYGGWLIADEFKGMKEVWAIALSRGNEDSDSSKLVWSAVLLTMNSDGSPRENVDFRSVWIKTDNNRLSFRTNKFRGVEYKFDGEFFKTGKNFSDEEKVLKGTMQKIVRGKTVAKFTGDFAYNEPHCFL